MTLTIADRIWIPRFLASQGGLSQMLVSEHINDLAALTAEEKTGIGYTVAQDGNVSYDQTREFDTEIDFSQEEVLHLYMGVLEMDRRRLIDITNLSLAKKICNALGVNVP